MLVHNAQEILLKSWSIRLNLLLGLLAAFTSALPLWNPEYDWFSTTNLFAIATFLSSAIAVVLRVIDQGLSPSGSGTGTEAPVARQSTLIEAHRLGL
jgi:hypothetical protein